MILRRLVLLILPIMVWAWPEKVDAETTEIPVLAESLLSRPGDTLLDLARAHNLGYVEMLAANPGLDPFLPPSGSPVLLPVVHIAPEITAVHIAPEGTAVHIAPESGEGVPLVVNLADMRLYVTQTDGTLTSYPVGIGRDGREVAAGQVATIVSKRKNPIWVPPRSIRAEKPWLPDSVPPGPDNPMGSHSLDLDVGLLRIHGTNLPDGVGRRVSAGCVRLYPEHIEELFDQVPVGTKVVFVDEPVKLGWVDGQLWLEVHPSQAQADSVEFRRRPLPPPTFGPDLDERIATTAGSSAERIDWGAVRWAQRTRLGVPVLILN